MKGLYSRGLYSNPSVDQRYRSTVYRYYHIHIVTIILFNLPSKKKGLTVIKYVLRERLLAYAYKSILFCSLIDEIVSA